MVNLRKSLPSGRMARSGYVGAIWDLLCHFDQTLQYSTFAKSSLVKDVWAVMKENRRQVGGILFLQGGSPYQNGVGFRARDITSDKFSHFNRSCEVCAFMETRRVKDGWVTMKGRRQVSAKDMTCFVVKNLAWYHDYIASDVRACRAGWYEWGRVN